MNKIFEKIKGQIPANKFYPPRIDQSRILARTQRIKKLCPRNDHGNILIEAQAGQGKTTLAVQLLEYKDTPYIWYQIGLEDFDPIFFVTAVLSNLKNSLPDFSSDSLEEMVIKGELSLLDLPRFCNILLNDLGTTFNNNLYIVFDDLHIIEDAENTLDVLKYLLLTAPPNIRFILLTRHPTSFEPEIFQKVNGNLKFDNESIALDIHETNDLLNHKMDIGLSSSQLKKVYDKTRGWIMGTIFLGHALSAAKTDFDLETAIPDIFNTESLADYFKDQVVAHIPEELRVPLLLLSCLGDFPVSLARTIVRKPDIAKDLQELCRRNFFVRKLDRLGSNFGMHRLFADVLHEKAQRVLAAEEIKDVYKKAVTFYREQDRPGKALEYCLKAEDYETLEKILESHGMSMLALNRGATLLLILQKTPKKTISNHPWMSFFYGCVNLDINPAISLPLLENAETKFLAEGNKLGELLTTSQLIYFHMYANGDYKRGGQLLKHADLLFEELADQLDPHNKILIAGNIATGFCFFTPDMDKAMRYATTTYNIAKTHDLKNQQAAAKATITFILYFKGKWDKCLNELESNYSMLFDHEISQANKIFSWGVYLLILDDLGNAETYLYQEQILKDTVGEELVGSSMIGPYTLIWNAHILICSNHLAQAYEIINKGFEVGYTDAHSNIRGLFLLYKAYLAALLGNKIEGITLINEAQKVVHESGGNHFILIFDSIIIDELAKSLGRQREHYRQVG